MKKKAKQNPIPLDPSKDMEEFGERLIRMGEGFQDRNTPIGDLMELTWSCGLTLRLEIGPNPKQD